MRLLGKRIKMSLQRVESMAVIAGAVVLCLVTYTNTTDAMTQERIARQLNTVAIAGLREEVAVTAGLTAKLAELNGRLEGEGEAKALLVSHIEGMSQAIASLDIVMGRVDERLKAMERRLLSEAHPQVH